MLEAIEQRLREGSPRSGARHVRLTDSVQVGENEFEAMPTARAAAASRWSLLRVSNIASIAIAVFLALYFAWQFTR
jgi:hypothetical protein